MGGDEFVVLLEESDEDEASLVAGRIVESMRTSIALRGVDARVSLSVGITTFADSRRDVETLLIDAGAAMSRAKADGGDRFTHYTAAMEVLATDASHELTLRSDLRDAIENGELARALPADRRRRATPHRRLRSPRAFGNIRSGAS